MTEFEVGKKYVLQEDTRFLSKGQIVEVFDILPESNKKRAFVRDECGKADVIGFFEVTELNHINIEKNKHNLSIDEFYDICIQLMEKLEIKYEIPKKYTACMTNSLAEKIFGKEEQFQYMITMLDKLFHEI